jgi:uncharacterized protein (TIGR02453 family)
MARTTAYFGPQIFEFLADLAAHNDRDWFAANRDRYEEQVKLPLLRFIADFAPCLQKISPEFVADPRPQGGSMFRIHRDTRFSTDKSPYKAFAAAQFRHRAGKDVHAPGYYLHLDPAGSFMGAGCWQPDGTTLSGIRERIVTEPARWKRIIAGKTFQATFALEGESLKRPPRGYDAEHPLIDDLKRKDFVVVARYTKEELAGDDFLSRFTKDCQAASGFMKFLADAGGVAF